MKCCRCSQIPEKGKVHRTGYADKDGNFNGHPGSLVDMSQAEQGYRASDKQNFAALQPDEMQNKHLENNLLQQYDERREPGDKHPPGELGLKKRRQVDWLAGKRFT